MKRISIVFLTAFAVVALFFVASAFTDDKIEKQTVSDKKVKQTVYEYFQFIGGTYSETHFENPANWSSLGTTNPTTNPCAAGTDKTCVLRIDQSIVTADPNMSLTEELADYLEKITDASGATDFVNANYTYRKP